MLRVQSALHVILSYVYMYVFVAAFIQPPPSSYEPSQKINLHSTLQPASNEPPIKNPLVKNNNRRREAVDEASELELGMRKLREDLAEKRRKMMDDLEAKKQALAAAKKAKEELMLRRQADGTGRTRTAAASSFLETGVGAGAGAEGGGAEGDPSPAPSAESTPPPSLPLPSGAEGEAPGEAADGALGKLNEGLRNLARMRAELEAERREQSQRMEAQKQRLREQLEKEKCVSFLSYISRLFFSLPSLLEPI